MKTTVALSALVIIFGLTSGCSEFGSGSDSGSRLYVSREPVIPDVPVPQGFSMDINRSYYNSNAAGRSGLITYTGKADAVEILSFFRDNMPVSGWVPNGEATDFGTYILHFHKGVEAADVRIIPGRFNTDIMVSLHKRSGS
jgi:hypothetical protein